MITLATTLGIETPSIVIDNAWTLLIYLLMKFLATKERDVTLSIQRPVERNSANPYISLI
jgi:hypothetical protein